MNDTVNFVVDIETMGHICGAAITEIAVVAFVGNNFDPDKCKRFRVAVDLESCLNLGMTVTGSTIKWWLNQSKDAQALYRESGVPINEALIDLHAWSRDQVDGDIPFDSNDQPEKPYRVWSHATFDFSMIEAAYAKCGLTSPWAYWSARDVRTILDLAFGKPGEYPSIPFVGVKHKALDDAIHEAKQVSAALIKLARN